MIRPTRGWQAAAVLGVAALVLAGCGSSDEPAGDDTSSSDGGSGSEALVLGTLLPQTGSLAYLGPPEIAGVAAAVADINAAGGVNGQDVTVVDTDSGDTTTDIASQSVGTLLDDGVSAIIGAASSSVSFNVIDQITGAGVIHISPANTSPDFTDYEDNGLYFRTAPSDVLQGRVMADLLLNDGRQNVAIMALQDAYGEGLATNVQQGLESAGGSIAGGEPLIYSPTAPNYSAEVTQVAGTQPDAIVLIGFDESKRVIPELIAQGIGPDTVPLYFVDGNLADYSADSFGPQLQGNKGTLPGAETGDDFREKLLAADPTLTQYSYGPESYDAAVVIALGAIVAGTTDGTAIAAELEGLTTGGTKCTTFEECAALLEEDASADIDYDGYSGPIEFDENGDPTVASVGIYEYGTDGTYTPVDFLQGEI